MMINTKLMSMFEDSKPMNDVTSIVTVNLDNSSMIELLAEKLLMEFERMAPYASYQPISDLTSDDLVKYLKTLQFMRVSRVSYSSGKAYEPYKTIARYVNVPVLFYQLLLCIGKAYDREFNLEFKPAYNVPQEDLLSAEKMEAISSIFRQFEDSGMKVVRGIPNSEEGELDFMAMSHVDDTVVSYKRSHPVYGFLASFFRQKELHKITGTMSRVIYGYDADFRMMLDATIDAIDGADLND